MEFRLREDGMGLGLRSDFTLSEEDGSEEINSGDCKEE